MKQAYSYKSANLIIKDIDKSTRIVKGYFSAFNIPDSDRDVIRPGAFQRSINANGPMSTQPRIKHLLNHAVSQPIGNLIDLKEDDYGLNYTSKIGTHTLGEDFLKMVDSDLIKEHSIGFQTIKQNQIGDWKTDDGSPVWEIVEAKLWEGSSLTGWGANQFTPLMKAAGADGLKEFNEQIEKLEKFCRKSDASDETIELLMIQIKQMQQLIIDMKGSTSTQPAVNAPDPQKNQSIKTVDFSQLLKAVNN